MDRPAPFALDHPAAVRPAGSVALDLLLSAATGERPEPAPAAAAGREVPGVSLLRQPQDGVRVEGEPQTHPAADAHPGHRSLVSQTALEPPGARPRSLPLLAAGRDHRAAQPRLERPILLTFRCAAVFSTWSR